MNEQGVNKHLQYRRLRAPAEPDSVLALPSPAELVAPLIEQGSPPPDAWQLSLDRATLVRETREQALGAAVRYTSSYRDIAPVFQAARPWLASGHQPRLFHPGVWIKNFVLSALSKRCGATPINLVIDNDLATEHGVSVPVRTDTGWTRQMAPWGQPQPAIPYEQHGVDVDGDFLSFGDRVVELLSPLVERPLVAPLWQRVVSLARQRRPLGECFAAARHQLEADIGLQTLELPLSQLFELPATRRWTVAILERMEALHSIHNRTLLQFRRLHRIRSRSHPVPDLGKAGRWLETPFWVWSEESPQRKSLWLRRAADWKLSDRNSWSASDARLTSLMERIAEETSVKIRPRALMTTMFARTVLADRFIHGIGGAKYDQLNDAMMSEFLGIEPPPFLTLTATSPLVERPIAARREEIQQCRRQLRELTFNPQRSAELRGHGGGLANEAAALVAEKADLLQAPSSASRHRRLKQINASLQPFVAESRERLEQELETLRRQLRDDVVLGSRETSFALFDEEKLPKKLLDLAEKVDKLSIK